MYCSKCGIDKAVEEFPIKYCYYTKQDGTRRRYVYSSAWCRLCHIKYKRKYTINKQLTLWQK